MAIKGSAIAVVAAVLLFSLVLSPPPVAEAARRTAQEYNYIPRPPRGPVFCPACVCCTPKPRFGCCGCCAVPIGSATEPKAP